MNEYRLFLLKKLLRKIFAKKIENPLMPSYLL